MISLGQITRLHGYKGAFLVITDSKEESALSFLEEIFIGDTAGTNTQYHIDEASWMPKGWKVKLAEISTENEAKLLIGKTLYAEYEDLPKLSKNEYYQNDLVGSKAIDASTGKVSGLFIRSESLKFAGPQFDQDRWWFKDGEKEFSIPANKKFIEKVDIEKKEIYLNFLSEFLN